MKKMKLFIATVLITAAMALPAWAGEWRSDAKGWWYAEDNGSYPVSQWREINGKYYYFGADGYMLASTVTPDGYQVGADGAWIPDQTNYPTATYAAFMRDKNVYMYGYWESPDNGYGAIRGEVSDVVDHGEYYELKNQVLTKMKQYNTKKEATAAADASWHETAYQLPNGKYYLIGVSDLIASEVVYRGSIYINKDVIFRYRDPNNYEIMRDTTFADYLDRIEEIGRHGNGNHIGAIIKGIDEKGYVTFLEYALDYFW